MKTLNRIEDPQHWNAALLTLPAPHVLQTWTWGELKAGQGWHCERWLWEDGARASAAAQLLVQQRGRLRLGYIPKGPIMDWTDAAVVETVLGDLERYAHENGLLLLKMDPDVREDTDAGRALRARLARRRWRASFEQIQFRNTMVLDLRPDLDTLMADMKSKWRYNVRLAVRRGVEVREATEDDLPLLYEMYAETALRDDFIIRDAAYYLDAWQRFMRAGLALPLLAEFEGASLSMAMVFHFGACGWYMYGASRDIHRRHMPNHLLQWEIIRRLKSLECTGYDMWGAPDELEEQDPLWGVYRFKAGFGAEFVPHIGAYDYAPNAWLYRFYAWLRPHLVALAQRRYWARVKEAD